MSSAQPPQWPDGTPPGPPPSVPPPGWYPGQQPAGSGGPPPPLPPPGAYRPPVPPVPAAGWPAYAAVPPTSDQRTMAVLTHIGSLFIGFLLPLIVYLVQREYSPWARHHAAEALNFQLTVLIAFFCSFVLMFLLVGFLLFPVVAVVDLVFCILAAVAANRGDLYRYPVAIRFVR